MGIDWSCWRVAPTAWAEFVEQAEVALGNTVEELFRILDGLDRLGKPTYFNLQKEWQALHVLLTGKYHRFASIESAADSLGKAVLGGARIPFDCFEDRSDFMTRFLTADEVRGVSAALEANPFDGLLVRFDPRPLAGMSIYRHLSADLWDEDDWDELRLYFDILTDCFREAAREGDLVVQMLH